MSEHDLADNGIEGSGRSVQRELGAISSHLGSIDMRLEELIVQQKMTNGRVKQTELDIAVMKDREERGSKQHEQLHERVKNMEGRPRIYALAIGGPCLATLLAVVLNHV